MNSTPCCKFPKKGWKRPGKFFTIIPKKIIIKSEIGNHRSRQKEGTEKPLPVKKPEIAVNSKISFSKNQVWNNHIKSLSNEASQILNSHSIDFKYFSNLLQQIEIKENRLPPDIFSGAKQLKDKILLLPSWDYVGPLLEAVLQNRGINARLVEINEESVKRSLAWNTGQCLPLNIMVQNAIDYMETNRLNPAETALWTSKSTLSCNLSMFPHFMKKLLDDYGSGMEKALVYVGDIKFYDFSLQTAINTYLAFMFGSYVRKISCRLRPYEKQSGTTDAMVQKALTLLYDAFRYNKPKEQVLKEIINGFESVEIEKTARPKVAIFGDLYVRDNDLLNQDFIKTVEENGGEVITTPYSEYMKIKVTLITERIYKEGHYRKYVQLKFLKSLIPLVEDKYSKYFAHYNGEVKTISSIETNEWLNQFGLNILHRGESLENILKIQALIRYHPDIDLFIQTSPSYCCPSLVTEAMASKIEKITGVPVITIEYDGTAGRKNESIVPYLKFRQQKAEVEFTTNSTF